MSKIFSWKVGSGKYAYLIPSEETNKYIRNRITDTDKLLDMSHIIDQYTESEYENAFNSLKEEVEAAYGYNLGDYSQYYNVSNDDLSRLVLLTGKDADNTLVSRLTQTDYNNIQTMINQAIEQLRQEVMLNNTTIVTNVQSVASACVSNAIEELDDTTNRLESLNERLEITNAEAVRNIDDMRNILSTDDGDITLQMMVNSYKTVTESQAWMNSNRDILQTMTIDYGVAYEELGGESNSVFKTMANNINRSNSAITDIEKEISKSAIPFGDGDEV